MIIAVADMEKIEELVDVLEETGGGPLMIREVAEHLNVSRNTASKYVDVAEASEKVVTDMYGPARRVWLPENAATESARSE